LWEEPQQIVMRWNGKDEEDAGYPKTFGNPMWFIVPKNLAKEFIKLILNEKHTNTNAVIEVLSEFYAD